MRDYTVCGLAADAKPGRCPRTTAPTSVAVLTELSVLPRSPQKLRPRQRGLLGVCTQPPAILPDRLLGLRDATRGRATLSWEPIHWYPECAGGLLESSTTS